ncbi:uncharacterized protein K02A2.6-like [Phlebotomus papatasi]|uniref:uncharacterized protein K02A2.6-like n=1 Tax=Phlebotomus papatasi TaxID=29031 RepID=UPI0024835564|nr:uncharacterized protein K02A2.6-like [Phlebotomus papatasi]
MATKGPKDESEVKSSQTTKFVESCPNLGPYDPKGAFASYKERLELWFEGQGIEDEKIKRGQLMSVVGAAAYETVKGLVTPKKVSECSYKDLIQAMEAHYDPVPNEIVQRYNFYRRSQKEGETIAEFIAELRKLSEFCNFGDLEKAIRDRLVCGIKDDSTRKKLLAVKDLTYKKACDIARAEEAAAKGAETIQPEEGKVQAISKKGFAIEEGPGEMCFRCKKPHNASDCWFREAICRQCGEKGHIRRACTKEKSKKKKAGKKVNVVKLSDDTSDEDETVNQINTIAEQWNGVWVSVKIEGVPLEMEVDSGASNTVISEKDWRNLKISKDYRECNVKLQTWLKKGVTVKGKLKVKVELADRKVKLPLIITKEGGKPLLGRNWFQALGIKVLVPEVKAIEMDQMDRLSPLIEKHKGVFREELGAHPEIEVNLELKEDAKPVFMKHHAPPMALRERIDQELDKLIEQGVIEAVENSEWATPTTYRVKPNGDIRICGNYRGTVNLMSKKNPYPLPTVSELLAGAGGRYYSKIDFAQAYQQLKVNEETSRVLTWNTHRGLYRVKRLPFGISAAPGIFQKFMETLLAGIPGVLVFLDDILVIGNSAEEHYNRLELVLRKLDEAKLTVKKEKCKFGVEEIEFVGYRISSKGIKPLESHIKAIQDAPPPKDKEQLQAFLGLVNFYCRFIEDRATVAECLHRLLDETTNAEWKWEKIHDKAFRELKEALTSTDILMHYSLKVPLVLSCDSSSYGVGAVLAHKTERGEKPISYFSRTLNKHQRNYAQIDKEALSIIEAVKHFHNYIYGRKVTIITDHKPLLGIFNPNKPVPQIISQRMERWCLLLATYDYEIVYRKGKEHGNADGLSRLPLKEEVIEESEIGVISMLETDQSPIQAREVQEATKKDPLLKKVKRWVLQGWPENCPGEDVKPYFLHRSEITVEKDILLRGTQVIIPKELQEKLMDSLHSTHLGIVNMKVLARMYMWWPKMDQQLERKVRECETCQTQRNNPPKAPLCEGNAPQKAWERLHVDFAGPHQGNNYLIVVDVTSKWLEVERVRSQSSEEVIRAMRRIFSTHGIPGEIFSDNGTCFVSREIRKFYESNGIKSITSSPWHPASNGQAERMVQTTKKALAKFTGDVDLKLARFLMVQHLTPNQTTGKAPCELLMGRRIRNCWSRLHPEEIKTERNKEHKEPRKFKEWDKVYARNFSGDKWIKAVVLEVTGPVSYKVQLEDGTVWRRHINQLIERVEASPTATADRPEEGTVASGSGSRVIQIEETIQNPEVTTPEEPGEVSQPETPLSELRRSGRERHPPSYLQDYVCD